MAQPVSPSGAGTAYRVFLTSGEPLPSYGEPVFIDDRVIFNLLVAPTGEDAVLQLVSLPLDGIDGVRTAQYTESMRAAHYGATRGETDYLGLTTEVTRVLHELRLITDPRQRLALAEGARRQLIEWPAAHFQYRVDDIRGLAGLFDGVINELRAAVGEPGVALNFIAGVPPFEPLLSAPTLREAIALSLRAADLADNGVERVEILRRATQAAARLGDVAVERTVTASLAEEERVGPLYVSLIARLRAATDRARGRGDLAGLESALDELDDQDRLLGYRRPADVRALRTYLMASVDTTREHREAVVQFEAEIGDRRRYAGSLRPLLGRLEGVIPVLSILREMGDVSASRLAALESTLTRVSGNLDRLDPPPSMTNVHALLRSALVMARQAAGRRRQALSRLATEMQEASSGAAGALLLLGRIGQDLDASLRGPSIQ